MRPARYVGVKESLKLTGLRGRLMKEQPGFVRLHRGCVCVTGQRVRQEFFPDADILGYPG